MVIKTYRMGRLAIYDLWIYKTILCNCCGKKYCWPVVYKATYVIVDNCISKRYGWPCWHVQCASTKLTYQQECRLCDPVIYKTTYVNTKMSLIVFWNCFDLASTCVSINIGTFSFACLLPLNLLKHWNDSDALSSYISRFWYLFIIIHFLNTCVSLFRGGFHFV